MPARVIEEIDAGNRMGVDVQGFGHELSITKIFHGVRVDEHVDRRGNFFTNCAQQRRGRHDPWVQCESQEEYQETPRKN